MRSSHFSLDFSAIGLTNSGVARSKLVYATRATRGYDFVEFRQTLRGRGFLLLGYSLFKRP